ncbi:MAG TPA: host attachment family protein [Kiloniellaceae bacterium]|nr:host attachment family protein [Kiloniellaceae bacterium]
MAGIPHEAWILVADGEKALVLSNAGDREQPNLKVLNIFEQSNPATREQGADRPGRFNDGPSVHRSAVDDTDWHRFEKQRFAAELAAGLYKSAHAGRFTDLIVVAPPLVLGELRKHFHQEVTNRILVEINKTLTGHPIGQIERRVLDAAADVLPSAHHYITPADDSLPGRILTAKD